MTITIDHGGRRALVTGAGAGIGREIARWLARAGADVAINDLVPERAEAVAAEINTETGMSSGSGRAVAVPADCRDDAAVDALVTTTVDHLGGLDLAVNNAVSYTHLTLPTIYSV